MFIGQLFQQLYNTADSLIVGRLIGDTALAAVTSVGSLVFLIVGFFMGFSMGSGVVIARDIGAEDDDAVSRGVHTTVAMGIVSSAIMRGLGKPVVPTLIMLFSWCLVRVLTLMTIGQVYHEILLVIWIYPITWALSSITYVFYFRHIRKQGVF